jgi:predicted amidohydrolase YtcJ
MNLQPVPDLILHNGRVTTLAPKRPEANSLAIKDGRILSVGDAADAAGYERGPETRVIGLKGRRVIPGLDDSHIHPIRGGLDYNMELRAASFNATGMANRRDCSSPNRTR